MTGVISASARGMMAAAILNQLLHDDREAFLDVYDRHGYVCQGKTLRMAQCEAAAGVAFDLCEALSVEAQKRGDK
jgi:hypothetical protein